MKHTKKQSNKAKKNLIAYDKYKQCDFYLGEDSLWYMNCKDNVGVSAYDLYNSKLEDESNDLSVIVKYLE